MRPSTGRPVGLKEPLIKSRENIEAHAKGQVVGLRTGFDLDTCDWLLLAG